MKISNSILRANELFENLNYQEEVPGINKVKKMF